MELSAILNQFLLLEIFIFLKEAVTHALPGLINVVFVLSNELIAAA